MSTNTTSTIKPWVSNTSLADVIKGKHLLGPGRTILISITDPGSKFPQYKHKKDFRNIYKYQFEDLEKESDIGTITDADALSIAGNIKHAKEHNLNILVHCHAGICRSGAVAAACIDYGFQDAGDFRLPNTLVCSKIRKALGIQLDESTSEFANNIYAYLMNEEKY